MAVQVHAGAHAPAFRRRSSSVRRYGPALLLAGAALAVTRMLVPVLDGAFLVLSMSAVALAALLGGFASGAVATFAAAVGFGVFFVHPIHGHDAWQLGLFAGVGLLVAWLTGSPRSAFRRSVIARREADERARQQACAAELGIGALSARDVDDLYREALRALAACLKVDFAAVLEAREDGTLLLRAGIGWREKLVGTHTVSAAPGTLARAALDSGGAVVVADIPGDAADVPPLLRDHGAVSGMSVVIGAAGTGGPPAGVLAVHTRARRVFSQNDVSFLQGVANLIAAHAVRLRSAATLQSQLEFVRAITGALAEGVFALDREGRITFVNTAAARMLRRSEAELVGRLMGEAVGCRRSDGSPCPMPCPVLNVMGTSKDCGTEQELLTRSDGSTFPISCSASPIVSDDGRTVGAVVAFQDITERRRAEMRERFLAQATEELSKSIDYQETLTRVARLALPNLGDWSLVAVVDERTGEPRRVAVETADPRLRRAAEEMMARYPIDLEAEHGAGRVLRTGEPELIPVVGPDFVGTAGEHVATREELIERIGIRSFMAVPLHARGRVVGVLDFAVSSGDRRFGPDDLALAEELARRCAVAIDNARLYREAQEALRAREEILAVVSHDLRSPLGAIQMAADIQARTIPPGPEAAVLRRSAESIQRVTRRMDRLIDDLVDLASIDARRLSIDRRPHDPCAIAAEAVDSMAALAQERGVALLLDGCVAIPPVPCDRDRVLQVLANLLGNALKVTPPGGTVVTGAELREGELVFTVSDTGPGIPPDELPRLFERYWRGTTAQYKGTGLGLTIAKGLVDAHGGRIWAESRPGGGSVFAFALALSSAGQS